MPEGECRDDGDPRDNSDIDSLSYDGGESILLGESELTTAPFR